MPDNGRKAKMGNVIRTWKWPIPKDPASLPADIPWMYCRNHGRADDLVPIRFEGETLYLCPRCGEVYSIDFRSWEGNLGEFCKENGISNVIFLNGVMSSATQMQIDSMESIL